MRNRLQNEKSPYLLQHAHNPVDWYPWGDEAFEAARRLDRPIFLSVGYSTCHWCHVMAHESFEDDRVAAQLNAHFVCIKVDREERPDIDRLYMTFVQATTGGGGWPMSVWLTPSLEPFYGGTYFPPVSRWGRPSFLDVLAELARLWRDERGRVLAAASGLEREVARIAGSAPGQAVPGPSALSRGVAEYARAFDRRFGGFGDAPKFPRPSELLFLLREYRRTGDEQARDMVLGTLRAMADGGMRDQVGGGFHRYSVDGQWRVPHFEKMLYDQAQLVLAYLEGAQASDDADLVGVAVDTLRYVQRDLTAPEGGFYSAEDADSEPPAAHGAPAASHGKAEGAFYLWEAEEIDRALGDEAPVFRRRYGIEPGGNALQDPQGEFTGRNIPYVARSLEEVASESRVDVGVVRESLERSRQRLFTLRQARPRPGLDDKVLTAWNGLMIAAFARAARVVPAFGGDGTVLLESAVAAARFIRSRMWSGKTGTLLRRYREGEAAIEAFAEDYAFLVFGLLELFDADPRPEWLDWAKSLQQRMDELFWDAAAGGWFSTTGSDPSIRQRLKEDYDGAEPSASAVAAWNCLRLAQFLDDRTAADRAEATLRLFATRLTTVARAVPMAMAVLSAYHSGGQQVVLVGTGEGDGFDTLVRVVDRAYLPFAVHLRPR
jgi:uncharacterized protein YyaL (SSP411 family)